MSLFEAVFFMMKSQNTISSYMYACILPLLTTTTDDDDDNNNNNNNKIDRYL